MMQENSNLSKVWLHTYTCNTFLQWKSRENTEMYRLPLFGNPGGILEKGNRVAVVHNNIEYTFEIDHVSYSTNDYGYKWEININCQLLKEEVIK